MTLHQKASGIPLDVKAIAEDGTIEGYGSIFGNVDSYNEIVEPGAFASSLKGRRSIKMLWQHDPSQVIGVWDEIAEDAKGLKVKGRILKDASAKAAEAYALLKAGALDGLSIGYRVLKDDRPENGPRRLLKVDLQEVSIVTFAANEKAKVVTVKSILNDGKLPTVREFETFLRDEGGFSRALATAIASKAAPHLRGEPEAKSDDAMAFLKALRPNA